jgi:hypothetical protein
MSDDRNRSHDEKRDANDLGFDEMDAQRQRETHPRKPQSNDKPTSKPNFGTDEGRNPRNSGRSDQVGHDHADHHQAGDDYSDHDHASHHNDDDMLGNPTASRSFGAEETRGSQTSGGNMPEHTGASHNTSSDEPRDRSRHRDDERSHEHRDRNYDSGDPRDINRQGDRSKGGHYGGDQRDYSDSARDDSRQYRETDHSDRLRRDDDR